MAVVRYQIHIHLLLCLFAFVSCSVQLYSRGTSPKTLDAVKLQVIDDEVRFSLNESLSSKFDVLNARLSKATNDFDAKCNAEIEKLGAECTACANTACANNPEEVKKIPKVKIIIGGLKEGIKKITKGVKKVVKKIGKAIGKTLKKVWKGATRLVRSVIRRTVRGVTRFVRRTVRGIGRVIRRVGRVARRVVRRVGRFVGRVVRKIRVKRIVRGIGRAIRRVGSAIRRIFRARIRFGRWRRWGKRDTEKLPACALNCVACRDLVNSNTEDVCGVNYVADQLVQRLTLIQEALNATHDDSLPMVKKVVFNGQNFKWVNNEMLFTEVDVTANIRGRFKEFRVTSPLPMFGDTSAFSEAVAVQIWKMYDAASSAQG